ncbi:MFS transporter [Catenuloplanes indicus]|uniref:MFS family arabinose efflux permease n=1 Tax=Catenuloplanes indicus TaxID=137267 RepID=A0AAE3W8E9_9ACTN|nr:MFS transporter [Catenuloplanes indicus]MDQ0371187.1 putative MFS family arabinose efflux permease [Catenuloplanes indicus]
MPARPTLLLLALGAFAVGTDNLVVNGVLASIAVSMDVPEAAAGQLVTVFALVYAVGAPVLAVITADLSRRVLLTASMAAFVAGNALAALAPTFGTLMAGRVLSALAAACYMGPAMAAAAALVPASHRGRALALVGGGLTVATALGVPLGTLLGHLGGWRLTFTAVAVIAAIAAAGIGTRLPPVPNPPTAGLAARVRVAGRSPVLLGLAANTATVAGTFALFTYIGPLSLRETPIGAAFTVVLLAWGLAAVAGNHLGGRWTDTFGADRTLTTGMLGVALVLAAISLLTVVIPPDRAVGVPLLLLAVAALGVTSWALPAAQLHRMVGLAPESAAVMSSLNSSATYLGLALGGALGGLTLAVASPSALGWIGALLQLPAIALVAASRHRRNATARPDHAGAH